MINMAKMSDKKKEERLKQAAEAMPPMQIMPIGNNDDTGDSVLHKDPNTELTKTQMEMGSAYPPYEGLLPQVTNFDHPMQVMSIIKDMTELDIMRSLGLPESMYVAFKGESTIDAKGNWKVPATGFNGIMRGRMGLVYPGIEGMEFHIREQIFRNSRSADTKKNNKGKSLYDRIMGNGE